MREAMLKRDQHSVVSAVAALIALHDAAISRGCGRILTGEQAACIGVTGCRLTGYIEGWIGFLAYPDVRRFISEIGQRRQPVVDKLPLIANVPLHHISGRGLRREIHVHAVRWE